MKKIIILLIVPFMLLFTGCEDFLSELPTKSTTDPVERVEQLNALLDNPNYRTALYYAAAFSSDDCGISYDMVDKYAALSVPGMYHYTFNVNDVANEASDVLWSEHYSMIYKANLIIENADKVTGSAAEKARVKAEAYFYRAYLMWELANYYCMPYSSETMDEPGLPMRLTTSMEEDITRVSLRETYAQIDRDLEEALKIDRAARDRAWRGSKAAVQAFLSRYYLHRGEYDKVITAADFALGNLGATALKNYNDLQLSSSSSAGGASELYDFADIRFTDWQEFFFMRYAYFSGEWFVPSDGLIALYDKTNDMRYQWFFTDPYPDFGGSTGDLPDDCRYSVFNGGGYVLSGPTIQEVMLNKAEAMVRKSSPDVPGAIQLVNDLRENRLAPHVGRDLSAATKEEALTKILQERRRELAFAHRWWDIRRFAYNETPADDVTITREFYVVTKGSIDKTQKLTYSLPLRSRRYAIPLNGVNIDASRGKLTQNTY